MKKNILFLLVFLIVGCATHPSLSELNDLRPGYSRTEIVQKMGDPISTDYIKGHYLLKYSLYDQHDIGHRYYYFIFDEQDKLVGWQEYKGQGKIKVSGIIIDLKP